MKMKNLFCLCLIAVVFVFTSCDSDDENIVVGLTAEAALVVESNKALRNQEVNLNLIGTDDVNHTTNATFYVNNEVLEGTTFAASTTGAYQIKATYLLNGVETTTATETIEVFIPKRKIVLEIFTGTWCGYCPRKKPAVESLRALTDHVAVVAIHGNSANTSTDPFTIEDGIFLKNHLNIPGYPTGIVNRDVFWNLQASTTAAQPFMALAGEESPVSISIASEISNSNLSVKTSLVSEAQLSDHTLVVYLLEDTVIHNQASYYDGDPNSPFFGMGNPLKDFEHNEVLRQLLTNPLGDAISTLTPLAPKDFAFTTTIPSEYDQNNLRLVVAIYDENGVAVNAQFANINEFKSFE